MSNIFKKPPLQVNNILTPELAKQIYLFMRNNFLDETEAFTTGGYRIDFCQQVLQEVKSIRDQAVTLIRENPDITAPQVKAGIVCTLLDVDEIGADLIKLFPVRDDSRTFAEFKTAYLQGEMRGVNPTEARELKPTPIKRKRGTPKKRRGNNQS